MMVQWKKVLSTNSSPQLLTAWINFPFDNKLAQQTKIQIQQQFQFNCRLAHKKDPSHLIPTQNCTN